MLPEGLSMHQSIEVKAIKAKTGNTTLFVTFHKNSFWVNVAFLNE